MQDLFKNVEKEGAGTEHQLGAQQQLQRILNRHLYVLSRESFEELVEALLMQEILQRLYCLGVVGRQLF